MIKHKMGSLRAKLPTFSPKKTEREGECPLASNMNNHFFAYMARMKLIRRWSLMKAVDDENIAEHSACVAQIAHALALIKNKKFGGTLDADRIAVMALYHETSEVLTGDLPTPIKYYNPEIRGAYKAIESVANGENHL